MLGGGLTEIGLAAAIEELRQELYAAQDAGRGQQFAFEVEEAQLELLLELRKQGQGDGRFTFGVASPILSSAFHSAGRSRLATCGSARFCSWPTRISPKE